MKVRTIPPEETITSQDTPKPEISHPSGLAVSNESGQSTVRLTFEFDSRRLALKLQPPEAKQLAKELNRAVTA